MLTNSRKSQKGLGLSERMCYLIVGKTNQKASSSIPPPESATTSSGVMTTNTGNGLIAFYYLLASYRDLDKTVADRRGRKSTELYMRIMATKNNASTSNTKASDSININDQQAKRARRVRYDHPSADPRLSPHWKSLEHKETDTLLQDVDAVKAAFDSDLSQFDPTTLALWSTVCGYCEALTTHKDPLQRYNIYPLPIDALRRLVHDEFLPFCRQLLSELPENKSNHRETVRATANAVWKKAFGKSKNAKDELHANSMYVCFRGNIDKRSLDCFGAALVTMATLYNMFDDKVAKSFLTLSEDHAYESHFQSIDSVNGEKATMNNGNDNKEFGTCEIAIAGNTKDVLQTRGSEVAQALEKAHKLKTLPYTISPETSWLYMRKNPVICDTIPMTIAALIGNINCSITNNNSAANSGSAAKDDNASGPLMDLKRELLWILKDQGHLSKFPFALMELGECEEHRTTTRGSEWVDVSHFEFGIDEEVLGVEQLYLEAISISKAVYADAQAYPYFYAGHYHKDAVWQEQQGRESATCSTCIFDPEQEYRLVESVRLYSEAARVASQYRYDMQLMKHMTKASLLMMNDIFTTQQQEGQQQQARTWAKAENAVAAGTWLVAFFDSLLLWEEQCGKQFCEVLTPSHKYSMEKVFQQFSMDIRQKIVDMLYSEAAVSCSASNGNSTSTTASSDNNPSSIAITEGNLRYFSHPRSKRLQKESLLLKSLGKAKVSIREMELTIPLSGDDGRRAKRARR